MSKNAIENQTAKEPNSSKKFSKVTFLQYQGLLNKKFNYGTMEFEDSLFLCVVFCLTVISKALFGFKPLISWFFPQRDPVQLYIGSIYNYLPPAPKLFMAVATAIAAIWQLSYHVVFNFLNSRKDFRLFKFWMKLTHELPVKNEREYRVASLSEEENKFWSKENSVNLLWFRGMKYYVFFNAILYGSQIFFVRFDGIEVLSASYILFQSFHWIQNYHAILCWLHCFFSLNFFYGTVMRFFSKKFEHVGRHLAKLSATKMSKRIDNRKLTTLVIEYNRAHHELIMINDFFKSYVGQNLVGWFSMGVMVVFVIFLEIDWRLKGAFFSTILFLYVAVLYVPFFMAKSVTNQIHTTKRHFENLAFHPSVNLAIKQKIESISELSGMSGFSCFDWFLLGPFVGLKISLEFVVILLLLIQAFYYYTQF